VMGSWLIVQHRDGWFLQEGRRRTVEPGNGFRFKRVGRYPRRPSATNGVSIPRRDEESACAHKLDDPQLPRKAPVELTADVTVPQTDTGGRGEDPKALERTLLKELGKMTP
jgi:hypothetical protein